MKMLLLIEALLLISAALQDHTAAAQRQIPLDMAPNSVDDQYDGCSREMAQRVETTYLPEELKISKSNFKEAWKEAENNCIVAKDNLTRNHSIAIYMYTGAKIYRDFNNDTRHGKQNYTNGKYQWYSLYFLLTDAIQILKKTQNQCFESYRGTNVTYKFLNETIQTIRFGSFASSSYYQNKTKFFGSESCFKIHTCNGAEISEYSKLRREKEVLIPPYETFKVTEVKTRETERDLWCKTVFVLNSTGTTSDLNCTLFRRPTQVMKKHYILL